MMMASSRQNINTQFWCNKTVMNGIACMASSETHKRTRTHTVLSSLSAIACRGKRRVWISMSAAVSWSNCDSNRVM